MHIFNISIFNNLFLYLYLHASLVDWAQMISSIEKGFFFNPGIAGLTLERGDMCLRHGVSHCLSSRIQNHMGYTMYSS